MATYKQLTAQLENLHKEVAIAQQKEIAAVIEDIKRKIVDYDLTVEELGFFSEARQAGQEGAAAAEVSRSKDRRDMERARTPTRLAGRAQQGTLPDWCLKNTTRVSFARVRKSSQGFTRDAFNAASLAATSRRSRASERD